MTLEQTIRQRLQPLAPEVLHIEDDSARHAGHPGAAGGGGHFNVVLVSARFESCNAVQRHRMVYSLLADLIPHRIHALSLQTMSPQQWQEQNTQATAASSPVSR